MLTRSTYAAATLTPAAGTNADLRAYSGRAKSLAATPLRTSKRPAGRIDRVQIINTTNKPATFYVAVPAPGPIRRRPAASARLAEGGTSATGVVAHTRARVGARAPVE